MTAGDKAARRERVARVAEHRKSPQMTYWISRARVLGVLVNTVEVWLVRPVRIHAGDSTVWRLPGDDQDATVESATGPVKAHLGTWTVEHCLKECRVVPDDDYQLIRVGEDKVMS